MIAFNSRSTAYRVGWFESVLSSRFFFETVFSRQFYVDEVICQPTVRRIATA